MTIDGRAYPLLLGLGALDAAGYSVIVPVAPEVAVLTALAALPDTPSLTQA